MQRGVAGSAALLRLSVADGERMGSAEIAGQSLETLRSRDPLHREKKARLIYDAAAFVHMSNQRGEECKSVN